MGLIVLIALVVYIYLGKLVVKGVAKRYPGSIAKYLTVAIFVLIPTWDIVPGYLYFQYLCEHATGIEVFKTIQVDKDYFMSDGRPDERKLQAILGHQTANRSFSVIFQIHKFQMTLIDKRTNDRLAMVTTFVHHEGWLKHALLIDASPEDCPQDANLFSEFVNQAIRPR